MAALSEYRLLFSGRVQGVGFRFTALHLAKKFENLTGYVRNMPDSGVEMIIETDDITFKRFLSSIQESSLSFGIKNTIVNTNPIENRRFSSFDIRF